MLREKVRLTGHPVLCRGMNLCWDGLDLHEGNAVRHLERSMGRKRGVAECQRDKRCGGATLKGDYITPYKEVR